MPVIAKKAIVTGRVQGVFYRATTRDKASNLGLYGYAKNLADGSVEVLAIGEEQTVDVLMQWLWTGSRASKVNDVKPLNTSDIDITKYTRFTTG